tara:strand:- start:215 stop:769 length:555 start_codon:yes stop_codon:yes gene_type:complete
MTTAQQFYSEIHDDLDVLNNDLQVWKGRNKQRLCARIYVALKNKGVELRGYRDWRREFERLSFAKLHEQFDHVLPAEYRVKTFRGTGTTRKTKQANGMTQAQQVKFDRFCKAPARLEKRFNKTAEYFLSCGNTDHLLATAKRYQEAAEYCKSLIDDIQSLAVLWDNGMRTGGDLESRIERTLRI